MLRNNVIIVIIRILLGAYRLNSYVATLCNCRCISIVRSSAFNLKLNDIFLDTVKVHSVVKLCMTLVLRY